MWSVAIAVLLWTGVSRPSLATIEHRGGEIVFSSETFAITFSDVNGSMRSVTVRGKNGSILQSGDEGLWRMTYKEGGGANASDFATGSPVRAFHWSADASAETLHLSYASADIGVTVTVVGRADGVDFTGQVEPVSKTVLEFALPSRLRFAPDQMERLVCPLNANESVGAAFQPAFFERQTADHPAGWRTQAAGPSGFISLFGAGAIMRADNDPPVPISITPNGRTWLGSELAGKWDGKLAIVNRPSPPDEAALVLADSPNGPYFSAIPLGRRGLLFRIAGRVDTDQAQLVLDLVTAAIEHLTIAPLPGRSRIGLLALDHGPRTGGWTVVPVTDWRDRLGASTTISQAKLQVVELRTARAMLDALASTDFLAILNPYGEATPVPEETGMAGTAAAVERYVRAGGNWFEVAGYPFYYELRPTYYYSYGTPYPPAFADFLHLDTSAGSASLYGVQPMQWKPWEGAGNPAGDLCPGQARLGRRRARRLLRASVRDVRRPDQPVAIAAGAIGPGQPSGRGLECLLPGKSDHPLSRLEDVTGDACGVQTIGTGVLGRHMRRDAFTSGPASHPLADPFCPLSQRRLRQAISGPSASKSRVRHARRVPRPALAMP